MTINTSDGIWIALRNSIQFYTAGTNDKYSWWRTRIVNFKLGLYLSTPSRNYNDAFVWKPFLWGSESTLWALRDNCNHSSDVVCYNGAWKLINLLGDLKRSEQRTQIFVQLFGFESRLSWSYHRGGNGAIICRVSYQRGLRARGNEPCRDCSCRLFYIVYCFGA